MDNGHTTQGRPNVEEKQASTQVATSLGAAIISNEKLKNMKYKKTYNNNNNDDNISFAEDTP